jgi:ketosteroid isomerase-like protein
MKRLQSYLFTAIVLSTSPSYAVEPPLGRELELQWFDHQWNQLRISGDSSALRQLLADRWVLTHSDGKIQHKEEYLIELATGSRRNTRIENYDSNIEYFGDTAIVTGKSVQSGIGNEGPFSGTFRYTRVWIWQVDRWVMVASHSSRITHK